MKKVLIAFAAAAFTAATMGTAVAQTPDTLAKISQSGTVNLGVRDSSGLGYTLGAASMSASIPKWPSASSMT